MGGPRWTEVGIGRPWAWRVGWRPLCRSAWRRGPDPWTWSAGRCPPCWSAWLRGPGPWARRSGQRPQCRSACRRGPGPRTRRAGRCPPCWLAWRREADSWAQGAGRHPLCWSAWQRGVSRDASGDASSERGVEGGWGARRKKTVAVMRRHWLSSRQKNKLILLSVLPLANWF